MSRVAAAKRGGHDNIARLDASVTFRVYREHGIAVVLISHRMPDVFSVADRVVVLRRGEKVADKAIAENRAVGLTANGHRMTVLPGDRGPRQRLKILQLLAAVEENLHEQTAKS